MLVVFPVIVTDFCYVELSRIHFLNLVFYSRGIKILTEFNKKLTKFKFHLPNGDNSL